MEIQPFECRLHLGFGGFTSAKGDLVVFQFPGQRFLCLCKPLLQCLHNGCNGIWGPSAPPVPLSTKTINSHRITHKVILEFSEA